jgi:hypothetical protein
MEEGKVPAVSDHVEASSTSATATTDAIAANSAMNPEDGAAASRYDCFVSGLATLPFHHEALFWGTVPRSRFCSTALTEQRRNKGF